MSWCRKLSTNFTCEVEVTSQTGDACRTRLPTPSSILSIITKVENTCLHVLIFFIYIPRPKRPESVHCNIEPWFHIPIEVDLWSIIDLIHANAWIVAKPQNMPRLIKWLCCRVKCDKNMEAMYSISIMSDFHSADISSSIGQNEYTCSKNSPGTSNLNPVQK